MDEGFSNGIKLVALIPTKISAIVVKKMAGCIDKGSSKISFKPHMDVIWIEFTFQTTKS